MSNWTGALRQAEALVSYSSSFLSVRSLLSDEFASVAMAARKLIASKHPLIKTARFFVLLFGKDLGITSLYLLIDIAVCMDKARLSCSKYQATSKGERMIHCR